MKLREYFFVREEKKLKTFFNNFFSSMSDFNACSREYLDMTETSHSASGFYLRTPAFAASFQAEECTRMRHGTLMNTRRIWHGREEIVE